MNILPRSAAPVLVTAVCLALGPKPALAFPVAPQNEESKRLLALPQGEADAVRRRDLLADLRPGGEFLSDLNGNVYGMTFYTWPRTTSEFGVCQEDRITLLTPTAVPTLPHIETQPLFNLDGDSQLNGPSDRLNDCDRHTPGPKAHWIAAPTALDVDWGARVFREAETDVAAGNIQPAPCERSEPDACRQWITSLNDLSKVDAVDPCTPATANDVCYVISIGDDRVTIAATMSANGFRPPSIKAIRIEEIHYVLE